MKIRVLGAGFYGCHIALTLLREGHEIELVEKENRIFAGASGGIPARLHQGFHYPRSYSTRQACHAHEPEFMREYGRFTRGVQTNVYAIAAYDSLVDFDQYVSTLRSEVDFLVIRDPSDFGLRHVEGAVLTGERHILTQQLSGYFYNNLVGVTKFSCQDLPTDDVDVVIDCTFCANDHTNIDRYEPCVVGFYSGPDHKAVTIMDGPFASVYPWNADVVSLSSAKYSPLSKTCKTWDEANDLLKATTHHDFVERVIAMQQDLSIYLPEINSGYEMIGYRTSIRAMPRSGADTRLVDVSLTDTKTLRVRAGKMDAIFHATRLVKEALNI